MRQIAARLTTLLGQSVIVENRPGAAGRIATEAVIKSPADGYTLFMSASSTVAIAPLIIGDGRAASGLLTALRANSDAGVGASRRARSR